MNYRLLCFDNLDEVRLAHGVVVGGLCCLRHGRASLSARGSTERKNAHKQKRCGIVRTDTRGALQKSVTSVTISLDITVHPPACPVAPGKFDRTGFSIACYRRVLKFQQKRPAIPAEAGP